MAYSTVLRCTVSITGVQSSTEYRCTVHSAPDCEGVVHSLSHSFITQEEMQKRLHGIIARAKQHLNVDTPPTTLPH